jgi:hypothetical protein
VALGDERLTVSGRRFAVGQFFAEFCYDLIVQLLERLVPEAVLRSSRRASQADPQDMSIPDRFLSAEAPGRTRLTSVGSSITLLQGDRAFEALTSCHL